MVITKQIKSTLGVIGNRKRRRQTALPMLQATANQREYWRCFLMPCPVTQKRMPSTINSSGKTIGLPRETIGKPSATELTRRRAPQSHDKIDATLRLRIPFLVTTFFATCLLSIWCHGNFEVAQTPPTYSESNFSPALI